MPVCLYHQQVFNFHKKHTHSMGLRSSICTMLLWISFQKCCGSHNAAVHAAVIAEFGMVVVLVPPHPFLFVACMFCHCPETFQFLEALDQSCNLEWSYAGKDCFKLCDLWANRSIQYIYLLNVQYRVWMYTIMTFALNMNLFCQSVFTITSTVQKSSDCMWFSLRVPRT
jgi:hypothetical protein